MKRYLGGLFIALLAGAATAASPASVHATYDLFRDGFHIATVDERFVKNGDKYEIVSATDPAGLLKKLVRAQVRVHSTGIVTKTGLRPQNFDYARLDDASKNVKAAFDWNALKLRMAFEGREETAALTPGTQDRLSIMYQFMFMPTEKLDSLSFPMTNGKKIEPYRYRLTGRETLETPMGKLNTLHLVKQREEGDNTVEVWLAAERSHIPVKVLIIENDGVRYEQVITRLELK